MSAKIGCHEHKVSHPEYSIPNTVHFRAERLFFVDILKGAKKCELCSIVCHRPIGLCHLFVSARS